MALTSLDLPQFMAWFCPEPTHFLNNAVLVVVFNIFWIYIDCFDFHAFSIFQSRDFHFTIFSYNDQMFTTLPPPFLTFFIFAITSCAFEAAITSFQHLYHS